MSKDDEATEPAAFTLRLDRDLVQAVDDAAKARSAEVQVSVSRTEFIAWALRSFLSSKRTSADRRSRAS